MTEDVQDLEARLLQDLAGDPRRQDRALRALIDRYSGRFAAYYLRRGHHKTEIDDLLQEVFLAVIKHARSYRGEGAVSAWLWQIARNAAHSRHRVESRHDADAFEEQWHDRSDDEYPEVERQDLEDCFKRRFAVFARAHPDRAQVIAMATYHGWKPSDIATVIGRTLAATREYLSQARKALKPYLADCFAAGDPA